MATRAAAWDSAAAASGGVRVVAQRTASGSGTPTVTGAAVRGSVVGTDTTVRAGRAGGGAGVRAGRADGGVSTLIGVRSKSPASTTSATSARTSGTNSDSGSSGGSVKPASLHSLGCGSAARRGTVTGVTGGGGTGVGTGRGVATGTRGSDLGAWRGSHGAGGASVEARPTGTRTCGRTDPTDTAWCPATGDGPPYSRINSSGTRSAISAATARSVSDTPSCRATHTARARCGRPARVAAIMRVAELPGPTSTKIRTPSR